MKNYYQVLGLSPQSSTESIKNASKMHIKNIENSNLSTLEKKNKIKDITDAYKILSDYHKRRDYDDTIALQPVNVSNYRKNMPFGMSLFNDNFMNTDNLLNNFQSFNDMLNITKNDLSSMNTINSNSYQSYASTSSGYLDKNGKWITENKQVSNNNGKINANHTITTKDKYGNIIETKKIPIKTKKEIL